MKEPDVFYILGNRVRRDLLSHLTCTECYFSYLSSKVSVSSTAVAKHLKIMEREGLLKSYEREGPFIGPARKYYDIVMRRTYVVTITPGVFWYRGIDLGEPRVTRVEIDVSNVKDDGTLLGTVASCIKLKNELEKTIEILRSIESLRDRNMELIKERFMKEVGDLTQLAILHYILLNDEATVEELSDRLNLKEREVLAKAQELDRFVPLKIKNGTIKIDPERLRAQTESDSDGGKEV
ncbi:MAG: helix-turn-helix domain-containing protein [Thermococci archaeon]|nr:helix-turn-helix domain-containing protein [Thermococci archaeon]